MVVVVVVLVVVVERETEMKKEIRNGSDRVERRRAPLEQRGVPAAFASDVVEASSNKEKYQRRRSNFTAHGIV
ncbi:uncharacterized protein M6B38_271680 [Iris pallida]|uniref:Uncharacterized protein n=1 Tax=Iris pallida TaxID=29817 RepID=A0AAX6I6T6_IRIPA|nr:uncharacterized protein M6B38_271680 [Iris pallida]